MPWLTAAMSTDKKPITEATSKGSNFRVVRMARSGRVRGRMAVYGIGHPPQLHQPHTSGATAAAATATATSTVKLQRQLVRALLACWNASSRSSRNNHWIPASDSSGMKSSRFSADWLESRSSRGQTLVSRRSFLRRGKST